MHTWGKLLRLALAPTAIADILAGIVVGAGGWPPTSGALWLVGAAFLIYHGAMVLNDWADRAWDAKTRADRPLPAGEVKPRTALIVACCMFLSAPVFAGLSVAEHDTSFAAVACVMCSMFSLLLAIAYDLGPRGAWIGPLLLAGCRAFNLSAGVFWGQSAIQSSSLSQSAENVSLGLPIAAVLAYGTYVFIVSRLGRLEDGEASETDEELEKLAPRYCRRLAMLLAGVGSMAVLRHIFYEGELPKWEALPPLVIGCAGAFGLWKISRRKVWERSDVIAAMGCALRRFLIFTACVALLNPSPTSQVVAALILCGFPISFWLRKVFPPS